MIKSIAYFPSSCARNSAEPFDAFLDSCRVSGIKTQEDSLHADAAVIWSVLWNGRMRANKEVYDHYRSQNKPVIVIDVGALYRGQTWKIAVNNINALGYYGHQTNLDPDRPRKLRLSMATQVGRGSSILVAAQHRNSLQTQSLPSIEDWVTCTVAEIKKYSDRPIIVRPHPRSPLNANFIPNAVFVEKPEQIYGTYDNFDLRFDFHAVVNYNSGPGIQAVIEDCPVIVDRSSLAWPVSIEMNQIEHMPKVDKDYWFIEITHTEYTVEEIRQGRWITRLEPALTVPV